MVLVGTLRQLKHQCSVAAKRLRWLGRDAGIWLNDRRWAAKSSRGSFEYFPEQFASTFLARLPIPEAHLQNAPPICWAFWLGPDEPNARRAAALKGLGAQPDIEFRLVRDPAEVLVPGKPFHPAFGDLNPMHKSDYLRAYVMHYHGGAYLDVKPFQGRVRPVIDKVNADPKLLVAAYREVTSEYVPELPRELGWYLKHEYRRVMGPSGFVFRPMSSFTGEWMRELDARLDYYRGALAEAGWGDGSPYEKPLHYPIRWSEILGDIIQPLCLKFQDQILFTDEIKPVLKNYR